MATNRLFERGDQLALTPTAPAAPESGDAVLVGQIPGVALTDPHDDDTVTVQMDGVFNLPVVGNNGTADAAIDNGAIVYADPVTAELSSDDAGVRFGYVLADVSSGATSTVAVKVGF